MKGRLKKKSEVLTGYVLLSKGCFDSSKHIKKIL